MEYIWKILHKPTGLYYCSRKGRWKTSITNLSEKGNFYTSEKVANKVLNEDASRAAINEAQTKKFNLDLVDLYSFHNRAKIEDFEIVKFSLIKVDN
jgi:diketogulonate reductase-like aldo/keto reductase